MTTMSSNTPPAQQTELTIIRVYDTRRDLLFDVWTDPQHVAQWWGPRGFTSEVHEWDAQPGGAMHLEMVGPDGVRHAMRGEFHEVAAPERLTFTAGALYDEHGVPALEAHNTVTFDDDEDGSTTMTLTIVVTRATEEAAESLAGMEVGWNQTLDRLAEHLVAAAS